MHWRYIAVLLLVCAYSNAQYYVSLTGSDSNAGSIDSPFKTLNQARLMATANNVSTIYIRGGSYDYTFSNTTFVSKDSGTADKQKIVSAYPGETVTLTAGLKIPSNAWSVFNGSIYVANLTALGITNFGTLTNHNNKKLELFFNEQPMQLARYPNSGFLLVKNVSTVSNITYLQYSDDRISKWSSEKDPWIFGYFNYDWSDSYNHILSINTSAKTLKMDPNTPTSYGFVPNRRFYGLNLFSELDTAGEYYLDRTSGLIYFYPPASIDSAETWVSITNNVFTVNSASYISFMNMRIMFARTAAVTVTSGTGIVISGCKVGNSGGYGITMSGTVNSLITGNEVYGVGSGGINVFSGDRKKLLAGNVTVEHNYVHDVSRIDRTYNPAIAFGGVGCVFRYNKMENGPHNAMLGSGNNHLFEYNYVNNFCFETSDAGAFYVGRSWACLGNILRYNEFYNVRSLDQTYSGATISAIYLDDQMSGWTIHDNVVSNSTQGILLGGGRRNIIYNNHFYYITGGVAVYMDNRGMNWQLATCNDTNAMFGTELKSYNYTYPPWSTAYPETVNDFNERPCVPVFNDVRNNSFCGSTFTNVNNASLVAWNSTFEENYQSCEFVSVIPVIPTTTGTTAASTGATTGATGGATAGVTTGSMVSTTAGDVSAASREIASVVVVLIALICLLQ